MRPRPSRLIATFAMIAACAGCADIPQVGGTDAAAARNAPYPDLAPLESILNAVENTPKRITPASIDQTQNRAARLRARAAALRGPVVDAATRARMRAASARAALR